MKFKEFFFYLLGILIVLGFFGTLVFLIVHGTDYKDAINLVIGALIGAFLTVKDYFFGTSKSSAMKDETIKDLSKPNV